MHSKDELNTESTLEKQNKIVSSYPKFIVNSLPLLLNEDTKNGAMVSIESYINEMLSLELTKENLNKVKDTINNCRVFADDNGLEELINGCKNWNMSIDRILLKYKINKDTVDNSKKNENTNVSNKECLVVDNINNVLKSLNLLLDKKTSNMISFSMEVQLNDMIENAKCADDFKAINNALIQCENFANDNNLYDMFEIFKECEIKAHMKECKTKNEWNNRIMIKFCMNKNKIFIVDDEIYYDGKKLKDEDLLEDIVSIYNNYKDGLKTIWNKEMEFNLIYEHSTTILDVTYGNYILNLDYALKGVSEYAYSFVTNIHKIIDDYKRGNYFILFDTKSNGTLKFKKNIDNNLENRKVNFNNYNTVFIIHKYSIKEHQYFIQMIDYIFDTSEQIIKKMKKFALESCNDWDEVDEDGNEITSDYIDNSLKISYIEISTKFIKVYCEFEDVQMLGGHSLELSIDYEKKKYNYDLIG